MDLPAVPPHVIAQADQGFAFANEALGAYLHITAHLVEQDHSLAVSWATLSSFMNVTGQAVAEGVGGGDYRPALQHAVSLAAAACLRLNQLGDYGTDHERCATTH